MEQPQLTCLYNFDVSAVKCTHLIIFFLLVCENVCFPNQLQRMCFSNSCLDRLGWKNTVSEIAGRETYWTHRKIISYCFP